MDTAVALVQAYLHVNGYFTVTEFPVLQALSGTGTRTVTDVDILALRFADAGDHLLRGSTHAALHPTGPDPVLASPQAGHDMIVGEVKEGAARLNHAMRNPDVLEVALARFGCCSPEEAREVTRALLTRGLAETHAGQSIRIVAFGDAKDETARTPSRSGLTTVSMRHVVEYLQDYLRQHWVVLRHAQVRDPAFGTLALLEKWNVGGSR